MPIPIMLATWRFGRLANRAGWPYLTQPGGAIDAVEHACIAVESDPAEQSVGFGGLPDADGRVTLDGCIMLSPAQSAGVACISGYMHPVSIARQVMERTSHKLLVGPGAAAFAAQCGFPRADLLTSEARQQWEKWRQAGQPVRWQANREEILSPFPPCDRGHDTIGVLAIDSAGLIAGACSTSGLNFKLPGRVGDSPIIGHGLYVDPQAGAATATGLGELMMGVCAAFLAVEQLRWSATPEAAVRTVLSRIAHAYNLKPDDQCGIIVLRPDGQWACGSLQEGFSVAVRTEQEDTLVEPQIILSRSSRI